jgi:RNA polymerase sigma-70 factor (ECF subfamily)
MNEWQEDIEWVARFKNETDKETPFRWIIRKYQERLYWMIRRMVVSHEDTNDILQNVFIKTWKGLDQFREDSKLYTWLYRIATNESLNFIERQKKKRALSLDDVDAGYAQTLSADKHFDANKLEWKLQKAIQLLPEKQKLVFQLRYYEEMPYEQMSKILDTSEGALKASYHHAVKKVEDYILNH